MVGSRIIFGPQGHYIKKREWIWAGRPPSNMMRKRRRDLKAIDLTTMRSKQTHYKGNAKYRP
jgi:hypothetical protein